MIKRVFSVVSDIIRSKRAKLSSKNLEEIVFQRENKKCGTSRLVLSKWLVAVNIVFVSVGRWLSLSIHSFALCL